jgi:hypothetical protein
VGRPRKLTEAQVSEILAWWEKWKVLPTRKQIAIQFGVCEATINLICSGKRYKPKRETVDEIFRKFVARETNETAKNQGDECTTVPS